MWSEKLMVVFFFPPLKKLELSDSALIFRTSKQTDVGGDVIVYFVGGSILECC